MGHAKPEPPPPLPRGKRAPGFTVYETAEDGLPDTEDMMGAWLTKRLAFVADGAIVPGYWRGDGDPASAVWVSMSQVGGRERHGVEYLGVTHWVVFDDPINRHAPLLPKDTELKTRPAEL